MAAFLFLAGMKESRFIKENKESWVELENEIKKNRQADPAKLEKLFIHITDNLSYARTFYSHRSVRYYLNALAQWIFFDVYKNQRTTFKPFRLFWKEELPAIIYHSRKPMLWSLAIFMMSFFIGVFSSAEQPEFIRQILGDGYVNMTIENIQKGDPMAVYKDENMFYMFLRIAWNNLIVSFRTFVLGLFIGIGTIAALLYNGIMVGSFQYLFFHYGAGYESVMTIWQHGSMEIPAIIIAGGAGLVMGGGLVLPGTYSRTQSLKNAGRRAIKIMLGVAPLILLAAFVESYITRLTGTSEVIRWTVIIVSLTMVIGYYVVLPARLPRDILDKYAFEGKKDLPDNYTFDPYAVRSAGEVFKESFRILRHIGGRFGYILFGASFLMAAGALAIAHFIESNSDYFWSFSGHYFDYGMFPWLGVFNSVLMGVAWWLMWRKLAGFFDDVPKPNVWQGLNFVVLTFLGGAILYVFDWTLTSFVWLFFLVPMVMFTGATMFFEQKGAVFGISRMLKLLFLEFTRYMGTAVSLMFISIFMIFLIVSPILLMNVNVINWSLPFEYEVSQVVLNFLMIWLKLTGVFVTLLYLTIGFSLLYLSDREVLRVVGLKKDIADLENIKKTKGLERE